MGKILIRAQEQNVFNLGKSGTVKKAFVARPVRYSTMNEKDILNYCVTNSVVPKAYMSASMVALAQCISNFLLNGHSVVFPNLGTFFLTSNGISEIDAKKSGVSQIAKLKVRFLPCVELKSEVESCELEMEGVYREAGENGDGVKFYSRVENNLVVSEEETEENESVSGGKLTQDPNEYGY